MDFTVGNQVPHRDEMFWVKQWSHLFEGPTSDSG